MERYSQPAGELTPRFSGNIKDICSQGSCLPRKATVLDAEKSEHRVCEIQPRILQRLLGRGLDIRISVKLGRSMLYLRDRKALQLPQYREQ